MSQRIANRDARSFVGNCREFTENNLFGEFHSNKIYVVYSYGYHFPIYANINGKWWGNKDKRSVTTSKHQTQSHPSGSIEFLSLLELVAKIEER